MIANIDAETRARSYELIKGTWDLHIHPNPSHFPRKFDDFEVIKEMDEVGMAGGIIKTHYEPTVGRAIIANQYAGGKAKLYGTVALNLTVGGINPYAAESAFNMGAKLIWMPTRDTARHLEKGNQHGDFYNRQGMTIYDEQGKVKKEVYEVLEVVKKYNGAIASGHLSPKETIDFCKISRSMGIRTVLTHPDWDRTIVPLDIQIEMAKIGVYVEKLWAMISMKFTTPEDMAASIRAVGVEQIVLGTDSAHISEFGPRDGNLAFIETLCQQGFTDAEIRHMTKEVPEILLNV